MFRAPPPHTHHITCLLPLPKCPLRFLRDSSTHVCWPSSWVYLPNHQRDFKPLVFGSQTSTCQIFGGVSQYGKQLRHIQRLFLRTSLFLQEEPKGDGETCFTTQSPVISGDVVIIHPVLSHLTLCKVLHIAFGDRRRGECATPRAQRSTRRAEKGDPTLPVPSPRPSWGSHTEEEGDKEPVLGINARNTFYQFAQDAFGRSSSQDPRWTHLSSQHRMGTPMSPESALPLSQGILKSYCPPNK